MIPKKDTFQKMCINFHKHENTANNLSKVGISIIIINIMKV